MYLLYADESGSIADPGQKFFVLAGIAVPERATHWIESDLDTIARRFDADDPYRVELHGSPMRTGRDGWDQYPRQDREQALLNALESGIAKRKVKVFGIVLRKDKHPGKDIVQVAFEQLCSRFDLYLKRIYRTKGEGHRGLILFDKSSTERGIQMMARDFKHKGHSFGRTHNYAEVPVFLDSRASRLIQLADIVAYALFRKYEHNDDKYYAVIQKYFDHEGGVVHGLYVR